MPEPASPDGMHLRRADHGERFVAFAFAAADLVVEMDPETGCVTYAAGAFPARFGRSAETFVGAPVADLVDVRDRPTLDTALMLLQHKGRLAPLLIRLADKGRTSFALAGINFSSNRAPRRMCLTFALPPVPTASPQGMKPGALAEAGKAMLQTGQPAAFGMIEVVSGLDGERLDAVFDTTLKALAPEALATEVASGRFGILGLRDGVDLFALAASLEEAVRAQGGVATAVASADLLAGGGDITAAQAARAMRQALAVFARNGHAALKESGFTGGFAQYVGRLERQIGPLRKAIRDHRFALACQPIVALADRSLHHYEALLRPQAIDGCAFGDTQQFVTTIEMLSLTQELDLAVATEACDMAGREVGSIAFNLSAQSMQAPAFRERLLRLLAASPAVKSGKLLIELTETGELDDLGEVAESASAFRDLGIPFCLDDFGAGQSDIRVLRALPVDIVKLDGSYVRDVMRGGRQHAIVAGMVEIARATRAQLVAEHIETEDEAEAMSAIGVEFGQGHLFGRPGPLPSARAEPARMHRARRSQERETWG